MVKDLIVIGAGVSGLQCARRLAAAGAQVLVLDRANKVGGRCATRRIDGQTADYGPLFLHGSEPRFLDALGSVGGAGPLDGWPHRVAGEGKPCQPAAFAPGERRLAFREGVNAFPQALSAGLQIRLGTQVRGIAVAGSGLTVMAGDGATFEGREVVLAMALEQSLHFLRMLPGTHERDGVIALLELFASLPCLTVIAGYPESRTVPDWDVFYPEDSHELLVVGNEGSKRPESRRPCLVYQATPRWSRGRLEQPAELWAAELLAHAAALLGDWVTEPDWVHPHRWRWGRLEPANELSAPVELEGPWGRLSVTGDLFAPGGGVQAGWLSGDRAAERILARSRL